MMVVVAWLTYCVLISAVLAAGALLWEMSARWSGRPARWAWLVAALGGVTLPWLLRLVPARALPEVMPALVSSAMSPVLLQPVVPDAELTVLAGAAAQSWSPAELALLGWLLLSLMAVAYVGRVVWAVSRARRRWRRAELDGETVYVTRNIGPAALGVRTGQVVLPAWAVRLDADVRSLLLLHEREHVRAGDPRLVFAGLLLLAAMPWNPVLWFVMLRLRNAIELDCDARVLARGADPLLYGSLLLEVGSRRAGSPLVMATFAEPRLFLEERIRRIARWPLQRRPARAALLGAAALALFATALSARDPLRPPALLAGQSPADDSVSAVGSPLATAGAASGQATPGRPELLNPWDVQDELLTQYPDLLRRAGLGGTVLLWLHVDTAGTVADTRLSASSGYPALDQAAVRVAETMRFAPATNHDVPVALWLELPVVFTPGEPAPRSQAADDEHVFVVTADNESATAPGRVTRAAQPPMLLNAPDVLRALVAAYPPALREDGVGGVTVVWYYVGTDGLVRRTQLATSSGHRALDDAALSVASMMQFRPHMQDGQATEVWVEMPIVFGAGQRMPISQPRDGLIVLPALLVVTPDVPAAAPQDGWRIPPVPETRWDPADLAERPVFTPMTVRPELQNSLEIQRALVQSYPPLLRDAGISGTPVVWFFVNEEGHVVRTQLSRTSSYPALDEAALRVAGQMRFSPAMNRDRRVPVWIEVPIVFTAR